MLLLELASLVVPLAVVCPEDDCVACPDDCVCPEDDCVACPDDDCVACPDDVWVKGSNSAFKYYRVTYWVGNCWVDDVTWLPDCDPIFDDPVCDELPVWDPDCDDPVFEVVDDVWVDAPTCVTCVNWGCIDGIVYVCVNGGCVDDCPDVTIWTCVNWGCKGKIVCAWALKMYCWMLVFGLT